MAALTAGLAGATGGVREKQHLYTCLSIPSCCPPAPKSWFLLPPESFIQTIQTESLSIHS